MVKKPYTPDAAAALLERIVDHVNGPGRRTGARLLRELLEAPLGDVAIGHTVVTAATASASTVEATFRRFRQVLESLVAKPDDGMVHDSLVLPAVRLDVAPGRHGNYVFTVSETYSPTGFIDVTGFAWLQLLRVVHRAGPDRVRTCKARTGSSGPCGRLFVRVGKRRFCSEKCQTRDYMQRFRAGDAGRG